MQNSYVRLTLTTVGWINSVKQLLELTFAETSYANDIVILIIFFIIYTYLTSINCNVCYGVPN